MAQEKDGVAVKESIEIYKVKGRTISMRDGKMFVDELQCDHARPYLSGYVLGPLDLTESEWLKIKAKRDAYLESYNVRVAAQRKLELRKIVATLRKAQIKSGIPGQEHPDSRDPKNSVFDAGGVHPRTLGQMYAELHNSPEGWRLMISVTGDEAMTNTSVVDTPAMTLDVVQWVMVLQFIQFANSHQ